MSERVLAIIVSHNPELTSLANLLDRLKGQVQGVCIVDNHSNNAPQLAQLVTGRPQSSCGIELVPLQKNVGLGAAHNRGIERARQHGCSHILILDQDSLPHTNMVANLVQGLKQASLTHRVSAVGPRYFNQVNQSAPPFIRFGALKFRRLHCPARSGADRGAPNLLEADFLISSGSLITLSALEQVGRMDEDLFIDHVDTDWFLRARSLGFKAFGVCDAVMQHGLGEKTHRVKLLRERNVPQHKPFRYYYIFRNSVLLYKRRYCWRWKWNDLQRLVMIFVMYGLFCPPRKQHLRMIFQGLRDGLSGRTGKRP